ncbi:MAG: hypothetical protein JWO00_75 [Candidatus Parcubacteria bacterium]|nr:hypothetical protein [Candidatus Parcubacteria bacterium]
MNPTNDRPSRLDSIASRVLTVTVVLAPLAFWPSPYFALEAVKTIVIAVGTLISAALFLAASLRERSLRLPPRAMIWTGALLALATIASSVQSGHFMKSFFGQGFEAGTGSFIILLLVSGWVAYCASVRRIERVMVIYTAIGGAFIALYLLHILRFAFGPTFASLGILNIATATLVGSWYSIGIFAGMVALISLASVLLLPLPSRIRNLYWVVLVASGLAVFIVGGREIWEAVAIITLGMAFFLRKSASRKMFLVPLVVGVLSIVMVFEGTVIAGPIINSLHAGYSELSLPWQMTLDVAAGELKAQPLFGTGPNRFSNAFLTYKPSIINTSDLWGVEFNSGFGLIPTFVVTEGFIGTIMWILFFVFFGILGARSLRSKPRHESAALESGSEAMAAESEQPYARFAVVSSFSAATFLWIMAVLYVMPHALIYYAFVMTGLWLGASVASGRLRSFDVIPVQGTRAYRLTPFFAAAALAIVIVWSLIYIKDTVALAYFDQGLKELTVTGDPAVADQHFSTALSLHATDIFWQGRAESTLSKARTLLSAPAGPNSSTTQAVTQASALVNEALGYSQKAIAADTSNYYNYLSAARVAEAASSLHMAQAYQTGVDSYTSAISLNPQNPSLYVSLARFQANNSQFDAALQTIGASLQVKNNYLESVFLLSQVEAAKGNLPDAITAAQFAINLNPQNALLNFQLGLFQYTAGDYAHAITTLSQAVKIQPDYANARYFLGLSYARVGQNADAIAQFEQLAVSNPNNQEIPLILSALRAGKSLFAGTQPALKTPPEKRTTPPLPERRK